MTATPPALVSWLQARDNYKIPLYLLQVVGSWTSFEINLLWFVQFVSRRHVNMSPFIGSMLNAVANCYMWCCVVSKPWSLDFRGTFLSPTRVDSPLTIRQWPICLNRIGVNWMGLLPDTLNCGLRMRRECRERFPRHLGLALPTCSTARALRTCRDACRNH